MGAKELPLRLDTPLLDRIFDGLPREHGFVPLRVEGTVPAPLRGTLYRNGPALFDAGRNPHWFDGRGAITAVRIEGGRAWGAVRAVRTPTALHDAGHAENRYAGFHQKMSWSQRARVLRGEHAARNNASINVLPWQGRLFAMMETTPPLEIDPASLESLGECDFGGIVLRAWNAHPRYVPSRRTTFQFGVRTGPKVFLDVYALPDDGTVRRLSSIPLPGMMEVHDFFATEDHLVFVLPPLWCHPMAMLLEGSGFGALRWRPGSPTTILVLPIDDPAAVRRCETEPFFFWHGINAYESGGQIVLDLLRYDDYAQALDATVQLPAGHATTSAGAQPWRAEIEPSSGTVRWQRLADLTGEFPAVHPAVRSGEHTRAWLSGTRRTARGQGWPDHLVQLDLRSGHSIAIDAGPRCNVGEVTVVARSSQEDDAWLLTLVRDLDAGASHLGIWDAGDAGAGPVARLWFDQLLPPPLHGTWVAA
jgi:all-trans-8'-apo-beta-carotenal 15,15'-oxygenase